MTPVAVSQIEDALTKAWRDAARKQDLPHTHTCSLTLVAWVDDPSDGEGVLHAVSELAAKHPIRAIVLSAAETAPDDTVSARISIGCDDESAGAICSEEIVLSGNSHTPELLGSAVRGLLVPDLPVYLWWRSGSPSGNVLFSELSKLADRVVVDSIRFGDGAAALDTLRRLVQRAKPYASVRDLNWQRTEPWRNAVAACFDDLAIAAILPALNRCSITYASSDHSSASARSLLMYGWLASHHPPLRGHVKIAPGKHWADIAHGRIVAITLTSSTCKGSVMLVREQSPTAIVAEAHGRDGNALKRWRWPALSMSEAQLLDRCIDALGRDAIFELALSAD
ncbi:MAG: glucose-6-phosphate dehydrogenase assembly protein OpcA [Candidatus Eremiobacteraeota bacterium]|nr:glucose-6-phosphate dehydrogenase assembly protein OpcA [Candidatus Eremiobacteraeota bacterium]